MSDILCNPACDTEQVRVHTTDCNLTENIRKEGFDQFGILTCGSTFTDITDEAEWAALIASGDLVITPKGDGTLVDTELTKEKLTRCSPEQVIDEISGFEWSTTQMDNETFADFDFEYDLKNKYADKTIVIFGCDGLIYYRYNWVTGENPGFGNLSIETNRGGNQGSVQKLKVAAKWNSFKDGLTAIKMTPALKTAIFG